MPQLKSIQDAELKDYLLAIASQPPVSAQKKRALAEAAAKGDALARREFIESFLSVVVAEAAARRGLGASFETLIAAGNRALAGTLQWVCADPQNLEMRARRAVMMGLREEWMKSAGQPPKQDQR
jgi:hypothetical protein